MVTNYIFSDEIAQIIKGLISEYDGGEIFFGCILNEDNIIVGIEAVCFGNDEAVLAPYEIVNKFNAILHNHPSGNLKPSEQDLQYADYLSKEGIGFFITNNDASKINVVVPPVLNKDFEKLSLEEIEEYFCEGGTIEKLKDDFEFREGQLKMALAVAESLNDNNISLIEAGTGIGKSLAYLIPVYKWAESNKQRIVISTNTINLQSQLMNKDIPFVKKVLKSDLKAVVVKGRRNYLCKLKIYNLNNELEFGEEEEDLNEILKWANITNAGDIEELNFVPANSIWERTSSDSDFCLGRNCVFFTECFFQKSRRKAVESNIIIVNHHILFADVEIRSQGRGFDENILLPPYRKVVFDEAHNIVKSASSFFSISFAKGSFYKFMGYLKRKKNRGFFPMFLKKLNSSSKKEIENFALYLENEILGTFNLLYNNSFTIFENIKEYLDRIIEEKDPYYNDRITIQYRILKEEWESDSFKEGIVNHLNDIQSSLNRLSNTMDALYCNFQDCDAKLKNKFDIEIKLLKSYQTKISGIVENLTRLENVDTNEYVTWLEIFGKRSDPLFRINATPLYINQKLCDNVFNVFDSVVLSSATFTVNKNFAFFKNSSGLSLTERNIKEYIIQSPFDYRNKVLFVAPMDIPDPSSEMYNEKLNDFLKKTIRVTEGACFVLFTSYNQLRKSFDEVSPELNDNGLDCLYQGETEKTKLLNKFRENIKSSLFATNSFWEGVDAPGDTLRYVILAKLPFTMPNEPIEQARIEDLEKKGLNPFMNYTLPSAVIRFRQGFGRLIRKKDDYGVVAILDSRVLRKFYGKIFFQSIPRCKFKSGNTEEIVDAIISHMSLF